MTLTVTHQARDYDPAKVTDRYVRTDLSGGFVFCEVVGGDRRFDVRQGTVTEDDLPEYVLKAALARSGFYPSYVEWPFATVAGL